MIHRRIFTTIFLSILFVLLFFPKISHAANFSLSPSIGTFSVGSTFDVSILLDTGGQPVNALKIDLSFPPNMLQVVSPSIKQSVIGVWTDAPKFDNVNGRVELQGGIPGGITVSNALVATVTFRVKSVGDSIIKFLDNSKILLNDGLGTNVLSQTANAVYSFKLPPPAGPEVVSETNPDQGTWYGNKTAILHFINDGIKVDEYSYILSDDPLTIPDDISEGAKNSVSYTNLADGTHYFHVKAFSGGVWGGTTHFAVKIDATPPAEFNIDIIPSNRTSSRQPVIQFTTTDALSGIDHYDLKIIPLSLVPTGNDTGGFFIETLNPYIPSVLELGSYDVIVRAYDKSGNYRESTERMYITIPLLSFINSTGLEIGNWEIPWMWVISFSLLLVLILLYVAYKVRFWRFSLHKAHEEKKLPDNIASELEELKRYREKYGAKLLLAFLIISSVFAWTSNVQVANAQTAQIAPPLITTISKDISNEEIFYLGGKTDFANESVVIYLENLATGETFSQNTESDNKGNWFYRHTNFLSPGNYLLWVQGKIGEELSPPGPQAKMTVNRTAVEFGGGRLSYEAIYLFIIILLSILILGLILFIIYHYYHGRKKHKELMSDIEEAKASIRRGFAVLKRDIEAELAVISKVKLSSSLSIEEKTKEAELLSDLEEVQARIGQEIWEIGKVA